VMRIASASPG